MNQKVGTAPRDRAQGRARDNATKNVALVTGGSRGLGLSWWRDFSHGNTPWRL